MIPVTAETDAVLTNAGRGRVADEAAVPEALEQGLPTTVPGFVESLEAMERGVVPLLADRGRQY